MSFKWNDGIDGFVFRPILSNEQQKNEIQQKLSYAITIFRTLHGPPMLQYYTNTNIFTFLYANSISLLFHLSLHFTYFVFLWWCGHKSRFFLKVHKGIKVDDTDLVYFIRPRVSVCSRGIFQIKFFFVIFSTQKTKSKF